MNESINQSKLHVWDTGVLISQFLCSDDYDDDDVDFIWLILAL